ncbi:MAG: vWA domain-containing protein, partial [Geminicoccaceae bacterium]
MNALLDAIAYFHFIRPWWFMLIPVTMILWWRIRIGAKVKRDPPPGLAPHLALALTVGGEGTQRFYAIDGVAIAIILITAAAAGPSWSRVANPLLAQTASLAIALDVSETMLQTDVAPSRLERAKQKIQDVVATRAGARTALIAYAGSAHQVVPLTEDPEVLKPFLEGLSPDVMPEEGQNATAALDLAQAALASEEVPGAILFVLDDLDRADLGAFADQAAGEGALPVVFLSMTGSDASIDGLAGMADADLVRVTPDGADVIEIERLVASAYRTALAKDERQKWEDRGWILVWPAALLLLFWFRRGWTMRWNVALIAVLLAMPDGSARADGIADWFFTRDQQGRLAYDNKDFAAAADRFEDPVWRG